MIRQILVVCVGNICRSPMAAAMLQAAFPHKAIGSAGIGALVDQPADPLALRLMQERGLDLGAHRGRQLEESLFLGCDLLLVMEQMHKRWIEAHWPQARGKVFRWGHWSDFDVPDPFRRDESVFRDSLVLLDRGLKDWEGNLSAAASRRRS